MTVPRKVLCVCLGNGDRSPLMAGVLAMYLKNASIDSVVESAGVLESAQGGGQASTHGIVCGRRIGIDLSSHQRRRAHNLSLDQFDLVVCVDDHVVSKLMGLGVLPEILHNAQIDNPFPSQDQRDHDATAEQIMAAMYRVVTRYFSPQ